MRGAALTPRSLSAYDCVLPAADHDAFDYDLIRKNAALIVNTRGVYGDTATNVVKA